jgi:hypothetical protein
MLVPPEFPQPRFFELWMLCSPEYFSGFAFFQVARDMSASRPSLPLQLTADVRETFYSTFPNILANFEHSGRIITQY